MRYLVYVRLTVDAASEAQAVDWARKVQQLMQNPMAKMALDGAGIRLVREPEALRPVEGGD